MAYGSGQGNGGGNRWPSFFIEPSSVHPFTRNAKDGHQLDMMIVNLPAGTTVDGQDLTGFAISVFQGKYTQEQLQQGRDVYVGLNPARQVEVFKGRWKTPEYQRIEADPQALADAVTQARDRSRTAPGAPRTDGPQRVGFAGRRDESGALVRDDDKMRASQAAGQRGGWAGARRPRPQFTIDNAAVHPFQRTARNGNTYDMMIVNLPAGTTVDGQDLTGFSFSAFQNDRSREQLANHEPVTVSLTAGRPVDLFHGRRRDPDYRTFGVQDPQTLVDAIKAALAASGQGDGSADDAGAAGGFGVPAAANASSPWGAAATGANPWGAGAATAGAAPASPSDASNPWGGSAPAANPWGDQSAFASAQSAAGATSPWVAPGTAPADPWGATAASTSSRTGTPAPATGSAPAAVPDNGAWNDDAYANYDGSYETGRYDEFGEDGEAF